MGLFTYLTDLFIQPFADAVKDGMSVVGEYVAYSSLEKGIDLLTQLDKKIKEYKKNKLEEFKKKTVEKKYVDAWIELNREKFPDGLNSYLTEKLENLTNEQFTKVMKSGLRTPNTMFIVSLLLGFLGIDRFMLGDIRMGLLKLFTLGCFGVLWIIDLFSIYKRTKEYNLRRFDSLIMKFRK